MQADIKVSCIWNWKLNVRLLYFLYYYKSFVAYGLWKEKGNNQKQMESRMIGKKKTINKEKKNK